MLTVPSAQVVRSERIQSQGRRSGIGALVAGAAVFYVLLQVGLYPPTIGIKDESTYLSGAYILRAGTIFADVAHIPLWSGVVSAGHLVPMYPPGESALLLPATLIDWHLVFAINLALQLVGFLLFTDLLRRFGVRREWALLYLFFPALVLFSRTVMTEVPSATLTLLALLFYFRGGRYRIATGATFGILEVIAYKNLVTFALLLAAAVGRDAASAWSRRQSAEPLNWKELNSVNLLTGFLPIFTLLAVYNLMLFGRLFGYGVSGFSPQFVLPNLSFYLVDLSILFPLMLLAPLFYRGPWRLELILLTLGSLLIMSAYYFLDNVHGLAENILVGPRLLLPVISAWLLAYASILDRLLASRRLFTTGVAGVAIAGTILSLVVSLTHQRHLQQAAAVRALIYTNTAPQQLLLIDDEAAKFITPAWGRRSYKILRSQPGTAATTAVPSIAIVYATQGNIDAKAFWIAQSAAQRLDAEQVLDRTVGDWRLVIWKPASG